MCRGTVPRVASSPDLLSQVRARPMVDDRRDHLTSESTVAVTAAATFMPVTIYHVPPSPSQ